MGSLCKAILILLVGCHVQVSAAEFRAAVARVDITPETSKWLGGYGERQSTGVLDRIYHRVVVLDDGATQFVLVSTEATLMSPAFCDEFFKELEHDTGISPLQVWWSVTHSHSTPEIGPFGLVKTILGDRLKHDWDRQHATFIKQALKSAIQKARANLVPARLVIGTGVGTANINRRKKNADGRIDIAENPAGPVDRQIGLIRIERPDRSLIALIANYPIHGTVLMSKNLMISGDAPGEVSAYVEEKLGVPMLFINGAAGDLAPKPRISPSNGEEALHSIRSSLGDEILAANGAMGAPATNLALTLGEKVVELERGPAERFNATGELGAYIATDRSGKRTIKVHLRFLKLNRDTVLWAAPLELFSEIAVKVRASSPFANTFYFGYVNGWLGYLFTDAAFAENDLGRRRQSPFTGQAEHDFTEAVVHYLRALSGATNGK